MAISEGTLQSLGVLRNITAQNVASKEAEKGRSAELAQTRIQADERRIDRMNMRLERLQQERRVAEKEFTTLTGLQANIEKKQAETGIRGTDANSFLQAQRMNAVDQQDIIQEQITGAQDSLNQLNSRVAGYYNAYNQIAPEQFEAFRSAGPDKSIRGKAYVTETELTGLMEKVERGLGRKMTVAERAGTVKRLDELGERTFNELLNEGKLNAMNAKLAYTRKKNEKDVRSQYFVDRWKQLRQNVEGTGSRLDVSPDFLATLPDVLTTVKDISQVSNQFLDEIGRMASEGRDRHLWGVFGDTGKKMNLLVDNYEEALDNDDMETARDVAALIARQLQAPGMMDELDYEWIGSGKEQKTYLRKVLEGLPIIEEYMDFATGVGGSDTLFNDRTRRAISALKSQQGLDSALTGEEVEAVSEDDSIGFSEVMDAIFYSNAKPLPEVEPLWKRDKSKFDLQKKLKDAFTKPRGYSRY